MGMVGIEPMISSSRGWQYTKITCVPKSRLNSAVLFF